MKRETKLAASLLLLMPTMALAQTIYGDWATGISDDKLEYYAMTLNDSGSVLFETCYTKSKDCKWLFTADTSCEDGHQYPALGNTDTGASPMTFLCDGKSQDGHYRYVFTDWKNLEELMKTSKILGLALPLASGKFVVYRFSLNGMASATSTLESVFLKVIKKKEEKSTDTITL